MDEQVAVTDILTTAGTAAAVSADARRTACPPIVNGARYSLYVVDGRLVWCDRYGPSNRCPCRLNFVTLPCTMGGHWWLGRGGGYWWCNGAEGKWREHARALIHVEAAPTPLRRIDPGRSR